MIPHREILALRAEWSLRADVIEKDWALGWVLAGIAAHPQLATWVFKGGTCLRKSYYETYRFSEDLDFTVVSNGPDEPEQVTAIFREISTWLADSAGLELLVDDRSFVASQPSRSGDAARSRRLSRALESTCTSKAQDRCDRGRACGEQTGSTFGAASVLRRTSASSRDRLLLDRRSAG